MGVAGRPERGGQGFGQDARVEAVFALQIRHGEAAAQIEVGQHHAVFVPYGREQARHPAGGLSRPARAASRVISEGQSTTMRLTP